MMGTRLGVRASGWLASGFFRNVAVLVGGTAAGQVVLLLSTPLLTRLYAPAAWGQFGLFQTFVGLAVVAVALRYEAAILSAADPREAAQLTLGAGSVAVVLSVLSGLVCAGLIGSRLFGYEALALWAAPVAGFAVLVTAVYSILRYWFIYRDMHSVASKVYVVQNIGRAAVQSGLGALALGASGLIVGDVVGRSVGVVHLARRAWTLIRPNIDFTWRDVVDCLSAHRKFPLYGLPSSLLDGAAQLLPLPLIVSAFGAETGGFYLLVQRILSVPGALIGGSVGDVFQAQFNVRWQTDPASASSFFWRVAAGLFGLGLVPVAVVMLAGPTLFGLAFGSTWGAAGQMAVLLAPLSLAALVVSPLSRLVFVMRGQEYKLVYDVLAFGGLLGVFAAQARWDLDTRTTLMLLSASQILFYGVYLIMLWLMLRNRGRERRATETS